MIAWDEDGASFAFVQDRAIVREDGAVVARPARRPDGVVRFGGTLCAVHAGDGWCVLVDVATDAEVLSVEVTGRVVDVRGVPVEGREVLGTIAWSAPRVGMLEQYRVEHAWFERDGTRLRRTYERARTREELPLGIAALVADGTSVHGDWRTMQTLGQDMTVQLARISKAPVVAVAGDPGRRFLADADGLIVALGRDDAVLWSGALPEAGSFARLDLSGDGRLLYASARTAVAVAVFDVDAGALVGTASPSGPGVLFPAPTGSAAAWLGAGVERIVVAGVPEPAVPVAHRIGMRRLELEVQDDATGELTALVRALVDAEVPTEALVARAPPIFLGALVLEQTRVGAPRSLLEPWRVTHASATRWLEGWDLRRMMTSVWSGEPARKRKLAARNVAMAANEQRLATRGKVRRNEALEAAILAAPDDAQAYLVYGDWLLEQGDPRGELVSVQAQRALAPAAHLATREAQLLATHSRGWLGPFADATELAWRFGFVRKMRVGTIVGQRWRELHALPILRFLEELSVGEMLASAVPEHGFPPSLVSLAVDGFVTWNDDVFARIPGSALRRLSLRMLPTQVLAVAEHLRGLESLTLLYPPSADLRTRIEEALPGVRLA